MPCHNEAAGIAATCQSLCSLDYLDYRVVFVDDASTDETAAIIHDFLVKVPYFHLLRLRDNQGKARVLNCALTTAVNTPVTVVIDADTLLTAETLRWLVAPFTRQPRLGAVTGNPLAFNRRSLLEKIQAAEFASIIGLIKRSQRVLGRVLTVSGCIAAYRTEALREIGGFSSHTATEDIDVTWRLQRHFWEVWFAPQAVAFIQGCRQVSRSSGNNGAAGGLWAGGTSCARTGTSSPGGSGDGSGRCISTLCSDTCGLSVL